MHHKYRFKNDFQYLILLLIEMKHHQSVLGGRVLYYDFNSLLPSVPTEFEGSTILTGSEADALMNKNKALMESNLQLEEQVRALEKNQIQMSEELASR